MRPPAPLACLLLLAAAPAALAEDGPAPFTQAQADRGGEVYAERCSSCHGPNLNDGQFGPSLKGARFKAKWGGKPAAELFDYLGKQMPPGQQGVLSGDDYAGLMAFLLEAGGAPPGARQLPGDAGALAGITWPK
jgi:mono/diheme cytochrome c family protein